ncbi:MAG: hypothetical protein R8J84_02265 [Mariprofundales bacterium]
MMYYGKLKAEIRAIVHLSASDVRQHPFFAMCEQESVEVEMDQLRGLRY